MRSWELLKHWQQGSKLSHRVFGDGHWITLNSDYHGNLGLQSEHGTGICLSEYLEMEDDDGWFVVEEGKWKSNSEKHMPAWELLKHLQEGKKMRHSQMVANDWIGITCDIFGVLEVINSSGERSSIEDVLNIKDNRDWHVVGELERFASLRCVEEQLLIFNPLQKLLYMLAANSSPQKN